MEFVETRELTGIGGMERLVGFPCGSEVVVKITKIGGAMGTEEVPRVGSKGKGFERGVGGLRLSKFMAECMEVVLMYRKGLAKGVDAWWECSVVGVLGSI